ncbi:hypothetical protein [Niabella hirudinis]|uniref:hypothetical protein n=1 Tax=Niabella hirudinis TaxID=1285929 RepID=UPI003EB7DDAD
MNAIESRGLALARGFIVLIMPAVHSVLLYSSPDVKSGPIGIMLGFLAEQPGAQFFMLQMGLFIGIGRPKSTKAILKRFLTLFLAGYLLNFLRLVLPYWWGGVPQTFLAYNNIPHDQYTAFYLMLAGDILQFAALAYLCCQLVQRLIKNVYLKAGLLLILIFLTPLTWVEQSGHSIFQYILGLFNGLPPRAFFPFFPWICYPLTGLIIAQIITANHNRFKTPFWFVVSVMLLVTGIVVSSIEPASWETSFYRLGPGGTLWHLGAALAWMVLFIFLSKKLSRNSFLTLLEWLSARITLIYFTQWIVIIWLLPFFGFSRLGLPMSLVAITTTSVISFMLPYLWDRFIKNKN